MGIWYATREDVKSALDSKETARNNKQVDRAIESASRAIEGLLRRKFYPLTDTRYFDWPNTQYARSYRLWLDASEVVTAATITSGGDIIASSDYFLRRSDGVDQPPYDHIEIDTSTSASFTAADTSQRSISIYGVFGYDNIWTDGGVLLEALDASETGVDVSDSTLVGVGSILLVDSERMVVTGKSMLDTTQNLGNNLTASMSDVVVQVTTGTAFAEDEVILIDAEKMLIVEIAGNNLIVKRNWDGGVLQTHTATADIYAPRTCTVQRGSLGTTAATHLISAPITVKVIPGLVKDLCIAEALNTLQQEASAYARTIGSGENEREVAGRGLNDLRKQAYSEYGRLRFGSV
jgi:hypothetical protein